MKKLIALFLIISFLVLNCATYKRGVGVGLEPGQKPGALLGIQQKDGNRVRGELTAVKENSLLLLNAESGADVSVYIRDVNVIKIIKKTKTSLVAGLGLIAGVVAGALIGYRIGYEDEGALMGGATGGLAGVIVGGLIGASVGKGKTIQIEGKSEAEINVILEDLRSKARVRDYQ